MDVLKTISLITSLVEPMLVPSNTVPSSSIKYAFMTPPFLLCSCSFPIWDWKFISAQIFTILSCGERFFNWFFEIFQEIGYSSAITSSCFHIHENKKLGGSTICWFGWKSAYASKLATHFLIQTSAWLNCNRNCLWKLWRTNQCCPGVKFWIMLTWLMGIFLAAKQKYILYFFVMSFFQINIIDRYLVLFWLLIVYLFFVGR